MDILSAIGQLYDASLEASYAGLAIRVPDSTDEVGRRVQRVMFPGLADPAFFDLGQDDGPIALTMLLIGDDHAHQADRLRNAFQALGPATLVHPWLGQLRVVPNGRAKFHDAVGKIRVTRVEVSPWRYTARKPPPVGTLTALRDAVTDLKTAALGMVSELLGPLAQGIAVLGAVGSFASQLGGYYDALLGSTPSTGVIANAAAADVAALDAVGTISPGAAYGGDVAAVLAAPSAAIAATSDPVLPAAVGPGDASSVAAAVDGRVTAGLLLAVLPQLAPAAAAPSPRPALAAAVSAMILADTVTAASGISYSSDVDAAAWRDRVGTALDDAADAAAVLATSLPATAGALWNGLIAVQAAWAADMTATIGRLPQSVTLAVPGHPPAWLVALYLSGDDPGGMIGTLQDLVTRNGLRRPWAVPATLEVLQP